VTKIDPAKEQDIRNLLELTGSKDLVMQVIDASLAQIRANFAQALPQNDRGRKFADAFAEKFKLPFTLLADEDKAIVQAYGVWGEKTFMGRKYLGTHRVTFLIGPDGRIKRIWSGVKPAEHAAEVLAAV